MPACAEPERVTCEGDACSDAGPGDASASASSADAGGPPPSCAGGAAPVAVGPRRGTAAANVPGSRVVWVDPENALAADGNAAEAGLDTNASPTAELLVTGFGFSLPPGAIVTGVKVDVTRRSRDGDLRDESIHLFKSSTVRLPYRHASSDKWGTEFSTKSYGGATDRWGGDLSAADVNAATFGVAVSAKFVEAAGNGRAYIDDLATTVYVCP